ncbi:UNVERIFIED_CONTAM: hypothetical protein Sindi_2872300 [Sesamum indicum]
MDWNAESHELSSTSKLKSREKAKKTPKSGDKGCTSSRATGTRILLIGECSNHKQRNKFLSEMDIIEIQATQETSENEAQDTKESSDKDEAVTPIYIRFQSLDDSDSLLELDTKLQPQVQARKQDIYQMANDIALESNLQEHILEYSTMSNKLKRNNSMEDNSFKTGNGGGKRKNNKGILGEPCGKSLKTVPQQGFEGEPFTWTNKRVWRRLDIVLYSQEWLNYSIPLEFHISPKDCQVITLCLLLPLEQRTKLPSSFKFQHMWIMHHNFQDMVKQSWGAPIQGYGMYRLQQKLYRLKDHLKQWNKDNFCNIFSLVDLAKAAANETEKQFDRLPSEANLTNLNRHNAALVYALKLESEFWRQKSNCKWISMRRMSMQLSWILLGEPQCPEASLPHLSFLSLRMTHPNPGPSSDLSPSTMLPIRSCPSFFILKSPNLFLTSFPHLRVALCLVGSLPTISF